LKSKKYLLFAISGSQNEIIARISDYYGFDDYRGSEYEYINGRFTGIKTVAAWHKDKVLLELVKKHDATLEGSIAVGDSQSDIPMMNLAERPIAFNPERQLFDHASKNGWEIVLERKNMIYRLENVKGHYELAKTE
jgi:phosphoserine phosphatase